MQTENSTSIPPDFLKSLTSAYSDLMKQQRTASNAFVRWPKSARRRHEFVWLCERTETLFADGRRKRVESSDPAFQSVRQMESTIRLNPYERELVYGYPYVIGRIDGISIRAPLFYVPVSVSSTGSSTFIEIDDDSSRFNSLPFRSDFQSDVTKMRLDDFVMNAPEVPITHDALRIICKQVELDLSVTLQGEIDGRLVEPAEVRSGDGISIVDAAALFVAPKTNYFIHDDLESIGDRNNLDLAETSLANLLGYSAHTDEIANTGGTRVYFPFSSNPSQRRIARLIEDPTTELVTVQGPPGTGKSLTIANLACHLVATGKTVLITSQKDKALDVVDQLLKKLDMPEMPMTLLRQDRHSKRELIDRLDNIGKRRASAESAAEMEQVMGSLSAHITARADASVKLHENIEIEHQAHLRDMDIDGASGLSRFIAIVSRSIANLRLGRDPNKSTAVFGRALSDSNRKIAETSHRLLKLSVEHQVGTAGRESIRELRQLTRTLRRDQRSSKNIKLFDQLKGDLERAKTLLKTLPCWIMTPDDVARLFPLDPGLFDVVIVDEASQCDLPSMFPALFRAKKAVIVGDSRQMQAQRFAFTAEQIAQQAWVRHGVSKFDPEYSLDPSKTDLLQLAVTRMDEEVQLNEHYRSLPQIIGFSNREYYTERLRLMRDVSQKRIGQPGSPVTVLLKVEDGEVTKGTQENPKEGAEVVKQLADIVNDPFYENSSIGIICLFEEQMRYVSELVARQFGAEIRDRHQMVVVNPDGFQGDERDIIIYSLSYDAKNMPRAAIAARQADRVHVQGMLNVAFTRARDEIRIIHSADIEHFGVATGAIRRWLEYCKSPKSVVSSNLVEDPTDSDFEADVIARLRQEGLVVYSQYPACGYKIDIVCSNGESRLAIECDGEYWHLDEHGNLLIEDVDRQEVLERAGWEVLRIPYRSWQKNPDPHISRVLLALNHHGDSKSSNLDEEDDAVENPQITRSTSVTFPQKAVVELVLTGERDFDEIVRAASKNLGYKRSGARIRSGLLDAAQQLSRQGYLHIEDGELFATDKARITQFDGMGRSNRPFEPRPNYKYARRRRW